MPPPRSSRRLGALRTALLAATLVAVPALATAEESRAAIVARVIAAYGGQTALQRTRVVRQEGTVTSVMREMMFK